MGDRDYSQLTSDEVHNWCVSLDVPPEAYARLHATLTSDERSRSVRFRLERDRRRFVIARGVLRDLLGRYLKTDADQIRFVYNAFGKPDLSPELGSRLKFNVSHSTDLALIAIAVDADLGVDLEYIRAQPGSAEIARHFFSPAEVDHLNGVPSDLYAEAFFNCWTKKEAYVKARGGGLAIPLTSFSVPLTADPGLTLVDVHGAWSLYSFKPAPGYVGALAIEGTGWRARQRHWQTSDAPEC